MFRDSGRRPSRYHIFVLSPSEKGAAFPAPASTWHIRLEQAQVASRKGFKDLAELMAYIEAWMQAPPGDPTGA